MEVLEDEYLVLDLRPLFYFHDELMVLGTTETKTPLVIEEKEVLGSPVINLLHPKVCKTVSQKTKVGSNQK